VIKMWRAGGGSEGYCYFWGYWTGEQNDLMCTKICVTNEEAEKHLSLEGGNPISALIKYLIFKGKHHIKEE